MNTPLLQSPYLREQRDFPRDKLTELSRQIDQAYIDIAGKVNARTIGIFPVNYQVITGERWYLSGSSGKQQTLRQVYQFTGPSPIIISHGINFAGVAAIVKIYGTFTDGTFWYTLPWVSTSNVNQQVSVNLNSSIIQIIGGGGSGQPAISSGIVVIEWLSNF